MDPNVLGLKITSLSTTPPPPCIAMPMLFPQWCLSTVNSSQWNTFGYMLGFEPKVWWCLQAEGEQGLGICWEIWPVCTLKRQVSLAHSRNCQLLALRSGRIQSRLALVYGTFCLALQHQAWPLFRALQSLFSRLLMQLKDGLCALQLKGEGFSPPAMVG